MTIAATAPRQRSVAEFLFSARLANRQHISNMNIIIYDCDCFHSRSSSISFYSSNATIVSFGNFSFSQFRR